MRARRCASATTSGSSTRRGEMFARGKPRIQSEDVVMRSRYATRTSRHSRGRRCAIIAGMVIGMNAVTAGAQASTDTMPKIEIFGFGQADYITDFKRNDPAWFDVNRPSKLPSGPFAFGKDGNSAISVRQSRFGAKANKMSRRGNVFAMFDFDMFGVGADAGQTTIRLRHAYGQWGQFGGGLLESTFMDVDV